MFRFFLCCILWYTLFCNATLAANIPWQSHCSGIFCIFYQTEGEARVPVEDVNKNGVLDRIEDIATQLEATRALFHHVLHFPDPLTSERYKGKAVGIEVYVRERNAMGKSRGRAFSRATRSRLDSQMKTLKIHISSDTDPRRNATPAHEYFHLIQYGQSRFMNSWYLEGMARWAEDSIRRVRIPPKARIEREKALSESYAAAEKLWHPLGAFCQGSFRIPVSATRYTYVDGTPVFKDTVINAPETMLNVLMCLHTKESLAAEAFGELWRKKGLASPQNTPFILECVEKIYRQCKG